MLCLELGQLSFWGQNQKETTERKLVETTIFGGCLNDYSKYICIRSAHVCC